MLLSMHQVLYALRQPVENCPYVSCLMLLKMHTHVHVYFLLYIPLYMYMCASESESCDDLNHAMITLHHSTQKLCEQSLSFLTFYLYLHLCYYCKLTMVFNIYDLESLFFDDVMSNVRKRSKKKNDVGT